MLLVLYNSRFICFNLIMYLSSITISFIFYIFSKEEFLMSLFFPILFIPELILHRKSLISNSSWNNYLMENWSFHIMEKISNGIPVMVILKNIFLNLIVHLLSNWRYANISLPCWKNYFRRKKLSPSMTDIVQRQ